MCILTRPSALAFLCLFCATPLLAQPTPPTTTPTAVDRLFRISGSFRPADGLAAAPVESVVFAIYAQESGGTPLWQETQSVAVDSEGHYSVLLGATSHEGLPLALFATGEPRWLGMQFQRAGEAEQARVLATSVPYALKALKASDADTLGGRPASAYQLAGAAAGASSAAASGTAAGGGRAGAEAQAAASAGAGTAKPVQSVSVTPRVSLGTSGAIGKFVNAFDLGNSVMFENAGQIGLGTTAPLDFMHSRFTDSGGQMTGYAVQNLGSGVGSYSGMLFYDQNGALAQFQGFNNSTHEYRINNIAAGGTINFMLASASKFLVRADGDIDLSGNIRKGGILFLNTRGTNSTGVGLGALANNTGFRVNAVGVNALGLAPGNTGNFNNAFGSNALTVNTSGSDNSAFGDQAMVSNTIGFQNTAIGAIALVGNVSGSGNTALGAGALSSVTGVNNIGIGAGGGRNLTSGSFNIAIGNIGVAAESSTMRIGESQTRTFIAGISGVTTGGAAVNVVIDGNGQLGTVSSSRRFKEDIADMGHASSGLLRLRPVTYRYKRPYADGSKPGDYGLIAEEVAEVYPDLVVRSPDGQIDTVQYHKLTPMLLNEVQKQNRQAQQQDETIRQLQARLAALESLLSVKVAITATAGQ